MKRRIIQRIVVFLLLGAILNVVVAWGCVAMTRIKRIHTFQLLQGGTETGFEVNQDDAISLVFPEGLSRVDGFTGFESRRIGFSHLFVRVSWHEQEGAYKFRRISGAAWRGGWPLFGLICWKYHFENDESFDCGCITLTSSGEPHAILPVRPLWPGFAINTIFYAAILWMVFFIPGMVKRTLRRRRGLCSACAYDLRGRGANSQICPECGASHYARQASTSCST